MYILSMFLLHDEGFDNFRESARGLEGKVSHTWFFRVVLKILIDSLAFALAMWLLCFGVGLASAQLGFSFDSALLDHCFSIAFAWASLL